MYLQIKKKKDSPHEYSRMLNCFDFFAHCPLSSTHTPALFKGQIFIRMFLTKINYIFSLMKKEQIC